MATFSISGAGTHALTASTTGLQVTITTPSSVQGVGRANPANHYHTGMLRFSDGTAYWDAVPIAGGPQFIPVPQNASSFGYAMQGGAVVSITEIIGGTVFFSGGGSTTLSGLTDILVASPSDGQLLQWNASAGKWENATVAAVADFVLLDSVELGSAANEIVLSAAGGTGLRHLRIIAALNNGTGSNSTIAVNLRMNADTTDLRVGDCNGADSPNRYSPAEITILDFLKTDRWKAIQSFGRNDTGSSGNFLEEFGTNWQSTAAITAVHVRIASGTFRAGSSANLYGLK